MHPEPSVSISKDLCWSVRIAAFRTEGTRAAAGRGRSTGNDVVQSRA